VAIFPENQTFHADVFWTTGRPNSAPTLLLLHALMSAHPGGYYRIAADFNRRGWNVVFPHLPFHYRRKVPGFRQGALCITANLIRNGETLRQAVQEVRTLMVWLRSFGVGEFALMGTSFGGWTAALTSFLERDLRFLALLQPIADVEHAIWQNPVSVGLRRTLEEQEIPRTATPRHAHLSSPLHGQPQLDPQRIVLCGGRFDSVSPLGSLEALAQNWQNPALLVVPQGHFGYQAMRHTLAHIHSHWMQDHP
jgi:pimeloyl-ACP methyl ester carboxylesterase